MEVSDSPLQAQVASALPVYIPSRARNTIAGASHPSLPFHPTPSHNRVVAMSQPSQSAFDTPDMDDATSEGLTAAQQVPPTRASAPSSGRGRGRGRWARTKSTRVTKPAQQKSTAGRGRRHKVYDSLKAQAAHERTQELKQAFSAVVKLVKPAAQEIADRSVNELLEEPALYKQVPEYDTCKTFLRDRHEDTIKQANAALQHGLAMAEHVWKAQEDKVQQEFAVSNQPHF